MATSIEARKKMAAGSLLDAWKKIKDKHKALATPAYKPDIAPLFAKYDEELHTYDKLAEAKTHLIDNLTANMKPKEALATKIAGHYAELKKLADQWEAHIKNTSATASHEIEDMLSDQYEFTENEMKTRRALWEQIGGLETQMLAVFRRDMEHLKAQSKGVSDGVRKLEDDCEKLATHIHQTIAAYQKIAIQQNDDDTVDALRDILDKV